MKSGEKIKLFRVLRGIRQDEIKRIINIAQATVSRFEKSEIKIKDSSLFSLSHHLNLEPNWVKRDKSEYPFTPDYIYFCDLSPTGVGRISNREIENILQTLFPVFLREYCDSNCIILDASNFEHQRKIYTFKIDNKFLCIKIIDDINVVMLNVLKEYDTVEENIPVDTFLKIEQEYHSSLSVHTLLKIVSKLKFHTVKKGGMFTDRQVGNTKNKVLLILEYAKSIGAKKDDIIEVLNKIGRMGTL